MELLRGSIEDEGRSLTVVTIETAEIQEVTELGRAIHGYLFLFKTALRLLREFLGCFFTGVAVKQQDLRPQTRARKYFEKDPRPRQPVELIGSFDQTQQALIFAAVPRRSHRLALHPTPSAATDSHVVEVQSIRVAL